MADLQSTFDHPVLTCAAEIGAALDLVAAVDPMSLPTAAKAEALVELSRLADRLHGLHLRVLAGADDVALDAGMRSAASWLAHQVRGARGPMTAQGRLAQSLESRWCGLREALQSGLVNVEQTRVIAAALDALPTDLAPTILAKAEAHLIAEAGHFGPKRLRILGTKVLETVAPDEFDDQERRKLEDEERRARQTTRLTMRRRGDGTTDIRIRVSDAVAGRLKTYLEAYASPRRGHLVPDADRADTATGQRVPYPVLLGQAFCSLLEAVPSRRLPHHGGASTSVIVTIDLAALRDQVGAAGLNTGDRISAGEAMRLACNASIMPLVLDGKGQPLHLGREKRLFDKAQRIAMAVRDGECRADGCDIPAAWTEAHHLTPWSGGGRTDIEDGVLLCPWHHHRAHDPGYLLSRMPNGDVRFRRRT
ncbi:hypothetical protein GCM10009844_45180 [Nocardioides koreensis]|uniref:HNH nuclease domain-containing protein n=1 Tax=Nocardioides koreensis TaxID=433651 RepID=A0ABN3A9A6_9ACTN